MQCEGKRVVTAYLPNLRQGDPSHVAGQSSYTSEEEERAARGERGGVPGREREGEHDAAGGDVEDFEGLGWRFPGRACAGRVRSVGRVGHVGRGEDPHNAPPVFG